MRCPNPPCVTPFNFNFVDDEPSVSPCPTSPAVCLPISHSRAISGNYMGRLEEEVDPPTNADNC